jgi:putative addiction module component (TIGR02574 family)
MSLAAQKIAEVLALPEQDRAYLAQQLIASLDPVVDSEAEAEWHNVLDRRSREIDENVVTCRPISETVAEVRTKLNARRQSS